MLETKDGVAIHKNGIGHYAILAGISIGASILGYLLHGNSPVTATQTVVAERTSVTCHTDNTVYPYVVTCSDGKVYSIDANGVKR